MRESDSLSVNTPALQQEVHCALHAVLTETEQTANDVVQHAEGSGKRC
jgi:hypothetical protein